MDQPAGVHNLKCKELYMDAQEDMHMNDYNKITALYSRLSVGDEDRDGGESNSIQNQKKFLESYARQLKLTNIRHYIDDDESGRFFDRSAYSRMIEDVENGKIGVCIMKDMTRWGRDYLQVGNAMEIFRRNNVRFIAVNNGIDSEKPDTLEFAPFINIMSEWYAKDISKKVKTGIKTKGMSGKPIATEAPYGYVKDPDNKDFWIIDEEAAEVVRLIFRLFIGGKNRNQIAVYLKNEQIPTPTFYMKDRGRGTCKNKALNEDNRYKWNKATLTHILTRQEYCGDVVNFKTTKHFRDKRNHYVDRSQWQITENVHEPIIDRADFEIAQRILENAPVRRPNGDGEIHPLSGLLFCKDCGAKMHIRIDYRNGGKRHVAYCSEYHKGKAKNPKCHSPHIIDADLLMPDEAERKGLGTPATRAAIIEKLVSGGFVERKGKNLIPTKAGVNLVTVLPELLTSPKLTADWEQRLNEVAKGQASPEDFIDGIEAMAAELVRKYSHISEDGQKLFQPEKETVGLCPRCGKPVYEGKKNFACSDRACQFVMWKNDRFWTSRRKELTRKMAADLLKKGRTSVKGMWSEKKGSTYDAVVILDDTGGKYVNFKLEFPKRKDGVHGKK